MLRQPVMTRVTCSKGETFSWGTFSASTKRYGAGEKKAGRELFSEYLNAVKELAVGATSEDINGMAEMIFNTMADTTLKKKQRMGIIQDNLGRAITPKDEYVALAAFVERLAEWRAKGEPNSGDTAGPTAAATVQPSSSNKAEYGSDLPFAYMDVDSTDWEEDQAPQNRLDDPFGDPFGDPSGDACKQFNATQGSDAAAPPSGGGGQGGDWLMKSCEEHVANQGGNGAFTAVDLRSAVLGVLRSKSSDDQLSGELFGLLGDLGVELVFALMQNLRKVLADNPTEEELLCAVPSAGLQKPKQLYPSSNIVVMTGEEKKASKQQGKKQCKKGRRGSNGLEDTDVDIEALQNAILAQNDGFSAPMQMRAPMPGPETRDNTIAGAIGGHGAAKMAFPEGTRRTQEKGREEVFIPAPKTDLKPPQLVPISEFDDFAQLAFQGMKTLNRMQSKVYPAAYHSNENLLICAPTGAGKTNVAMMAVLHEVGVNFVGGVLQRDQFKIVYVAPMKALAAEVTSTFSRRLQGLGVVVRELTGDMQLTKKEIAETQMLVTTPEKWDVITRKTSDMALTTAVKLLIFDEVHLLHDERGAVIESLVARTLRQVESTQSMIRIVGLSATLPNYVDVGTFLRVNPDTGLFYFDAKYRPVPLEQNYIGITETNNFKRLHVFNEVTFEKAARSVRQGNQVMVFVHARNDCFKTARALMDMAINNEELHEFEPHAHEKYDQGSREMGKSRNKQAQELFEGGFSIHNAGMLRSDRNLVEKLFGMGLVKVLVCTATLAWGVNLPAHTVIIKGTQIYNAEKGGFMELSMLDVMQMFGRAGRPQFDTSGEGIIITSHDKLNHYLALMNQQLPIESQYDKKLPDNLNAEIVLGTVTTLDEAVTWLSYTYYFVRAMRNPLVYGIAWDEKETDPQLYGYRKKIIKQAAETLDKCQMIRYDQKSGVMSPTDLGRVASHYYIQYVTMDMYNRALRPSMTEMDVLDLVSCSEEFAQVKVRDEDMKEMDRLHSAACPVAVKGAVENVNGKVNILMQAYISHACLDNFALVSDSNFVQQSAGRLFKGLFEVAMKRGSTHLADLMMNMCKCLEQRMWDFQHPLRQLNTLKPEIIMKLEEKDISIDTLWETDANDIGHMLHHVAAGRVVKGAVARFPYVKLEAKVQPITRTVLRVEVVITPEFEWHDRIHGTVQPWHIRVEDSENEHIYHHEEFLLFKKQLGMPHHINFTIPIWEPLPPQFFIHAQSDRFLGAETLLPISFNDLVLPSKHPPHTELLDLNPLPRSCLNNPLYESLYSFSHFNPVQTQIFHTAYHTDENILAGAPTGSGKTVIAELAMFRSFSQYPNQKVVYVAPLKALVRERVKDWKKKVGKVLGKKIVEMTGDYTPSMQHIVAADLIIVTPEKWDGVSRHWKDRDYVKKVGLVIIDEIHLLGNDRGPILEVIVSRMRYISSQTGNACRIVGLSTALSNAHDLADWLGIGMQGLYNFRPSVRPVPLECHIKGFPGKHYCPRMQTMNKPVFQDIQQYSPEKPVLVFVSSRRQTRLTAMDLISFLAAEDHPRQWMHMSSEELADAQSCIRDSNLRNFLEFGIGMHHAGLKPEDKDIVEELYCAQKIQVVICTSTLAWGVNFPAHLCVIKGTEFFDAATRRYVDFPITDMLQMMGRAGRPQFDNHGVASILVHEPKKNFYKKFLYEPFPVESSLPSQLHDHFNAEVVGGTISSKQDAVDYLTWTFFYRRLMMNPSYYHLAGVEDDEVNDFLSDMVEQTITDLEMAGCLAVDEDDNVEPLTLGHIASYYYLHYTTVRMLYDRLDEDNALDECLQILCDSSEYDELPVRHTEDKLNSELAEKVKWEVDSRSLDSPHTKANLLLQAYFSDLPLPISDYYTDTKMVLDQAMRLLQAMVDVAADAGFLMTSLRLMNIAQMIVQGRWHDTSTLLTLPHIEEEHLRQLSKHRIECLPQLLGQSHKQLSQVFGKLGLRKHEVSKVVDVVQKLPQIEVKWSLKSADVPAGEDGIVSIQLRRMNRGSIGAYAPRFPKHVEEGWWLVLGEESEGELLGLKRIRFTNQTKTQLTFMANGAKGDARQDDELEPGKMKITLFLMCDAYIGLDQQYSMQVNVTEPLSESEGSEGGSDDYESA